MNFKLIFSLFFSIGVFFLVPASLFAAGHSVTPLIIDRALEKRDIVSEVITVTNRTNRTIRVFPSINEISVDKEDAVEVFTEPSMSDNSVSITSWVQLPRKRIEIQAGESQNINVTIRVNPEVKAGEYHAFIGFGEGSNRPEAEKKVREGQAPGTILRISVDKVQNQFLRLEKFNIERFVVKNTTEDNITYVVNNPGESPVVPAGEIIFYDNNGTEIDSLDLNPQGVEVTADETQVFVTKIPESLTVGKYKAFLSVEYGENLTASIQDTAFFYVIPLKQLIIIFALLLFFSITIAIYVHRKYDVHGDGNNDGTDDVPMYIRNERSESKDHDIDLSTKNSQ